jgi:hypothetical protein
MNNLVESLDSHMLSNNFIKKFTPPNKEKEKSECTQNKDTLFNIFVLMLKGEKDFEMLKMQENLTEKQLKLKVADTLYSRKTKIKAYGVATINNIEEDLLHNDKIDVKTFFSLCAMENLNVILLNKSIGAFLNCKMDETFFLVKKNEDMFTLERDKVDKNQLQNIYWLENIKKPLKPVGNYKIAELKVVYNHVKGKESGKQTKKELYEELVKFVRL